MANDESDHNLVGDFLADRDERVFRELYRRHTPALYLFAVRLLGGEQDAADVVQEVWIRAVESLGRFRWESSLRTWLFGITANCCREVVRKRERFTEQVVDGRETPFTSTRDLEVLIQRLPDGAREVLVMHDVEGYTHEEIGGLLGIAVGTSKHQLFRARTKLREWLSQRPPREGQMHDE